MLNPFKSPCHTHHQERRVRGYHLALALSCLPACGDQTSTPSTVNTPIRLADAQLLAWQLHCSIAEVAYMAGAFVLPQYPPTALGLDWTIVCGNNDEQYLFRYPDSHIDTTTRPYRVIDTSPGQKFDIAVGQLVAVTAREDPIPILEDIPEASDFLVFRASSRFFLISTGGFERERRFGEEVKVAPTSGSVLSAPSPVRHAVCSSPPGAPALSSGTLAASRISRSAKAVTLVASEGRIHCPLDVFLAAELELGGVTLCVAPEDSNSTFSPVPGIALRRTDGSWSVSKDDVTTALRGHSVLRLQSAHSNGYGSGDEPGTLVVIANEEWVILLSSERSHCWVYRCE